MSYTGLLRIAGGMDSTVWLNPGDSSVIKFYRNLPPEDLLVYHKLQNHFAGLVAAELDGVIRIPGNVSWNGKMIRNTRLSIITLPESGVYDSYEQLRGQKTKSKVCPEGFGYRSLAQIPFISGVRLASQGDKKTIELVRVINRELISLGVPLSEGNGISPENIKVSFHEGELDLTITDVGSDMVEFIAQSQSVTV